MSSMPQPDSTTSRREQRRVVQQDLARSQLLDAAEEVFGRKGYHDTTLKEIAALAEFSVGSVYSFFTNKDDLFLSIWVRRGEQFTPDLEAELAATGDPVDALHRIVDFEVGFFRRHPNFGRLVLRAGGHSVLSIETPRSAWLAANTEHVLGLHAEVVRQGQEAGEFRAGDPAAMARLLSGMVQAFQGIDPLVVGGDEPARMGLEELHAIVDAAFRVP
jgi:TetR/AcrR family transcriptional regulator